MGVPFCWFVLACSLISGFVPLHAVMRVSSYNCSYTGWFSHGICVVGSNLQFCSLSFPTDLVVSYYYLRF